MKNLSRKHLCLWVIGLAVMVMCAACASTADKPAKSVPESVPPVPVTPEQREQQPTPPPERTVVPSTPPPETQYFNHTVKFKGESLSIIAGWYTGDIQNWKVLAETNPEINPNRIFEGNKIRIPEHMVKNKAPMTKEYVDSFYSRGPKKEPERPSRKEDDLKIFGPK